MRRLLLVLPLTLLTACAARAPGDRPLSQHGSPEPEDCALTVRFGSYAMGIDREAATRIETLLSAEDAVTTSRHPWGREGEFTLCVRTSSAEVARSLFERITPLLPKEPRGPIEVELSDGTRHRVPRS